MSSAAHDSSDSDDDATREAPAPPPGCDHDHSAEQRIYDLTPTENLACCALYKRQGNLYYREGQFSRAVDRYARALTYYEYCFPKTDAGTAALERVRLTCLLNTAACDLKMARWSEAVSHATQALTIDPESVKALFRRAVAERHLGDFEAAAEDLAAAIALDPDDLTLAREKAILARRRRGYVSRAARVERRMGRGLAGDGDAAGRGGADGDGDAGDDDARSVASDASFATDATALSATLSLEGGELGAGSGGGGGLDSIGVGNGDTEGRGGLGGGRPWMVAADLLKL